MSQVVPFERAKEAGLEKLAHALRNNPSLNPEVEALAYVNKANGYPNVGAVLNGAKLLLMACFADEIRSLKPLQDKFWQLGVLKIKPVLKGKAQAMLPQFDPDKSLHCHDIPAKDVLSLLQARREGVVRLTFELPEEPQCGVSFLAQTLQVKVDDQPAEQWLMAVVQGLWRTRFQAKLQSELLERLRDQASKSVLPQFVKTWQTRLAEKPMPSRVIMGLYACGRGGVGVAVIDASGAYVGGTIVHPFPPRGEHHDSLIDLARCLANYDVATIAVGQSANNPNFKRLMHDVFTLYPDLKIPYRWVRVDGVSEYAKTTWQEDDAELEPYPIRCAIATARRLQNPRVELLKIPVTSLNLGRYQQDVNQAQLSKALKAASERSLAPKKTKVFNTSMADALSSLKRDLES